MPILKKRTILPTAEEDRESTRHAVEDDTLLTDEQLANMKPISHFPELARLVKRGRPIADSHKKPVQIRLSPDIVSAFKSTGKGWQTRINEALRDWLKEHRL
jgi:uncharacterized protein (DUF4415 family)